LLHPAIMYLICIEASGEPVEPLHPAIVELHLLLCRSPIVDPVTISL